MIKHRNKFLFGIFLLAVFFLLPQDFVAQCAMCKQAAESSLKSNPGSLARGLNSGILYLMAVPYLLIMFIFRKQVVQIFRKVFKRQAAGEAGSH